MGRQPCCDKLGVKKGPWTAEEDKKLINFILTNGQCCWRAVPKLAGLRRCGKSCRLRWTNYLRPDLKRGLLTEAEEQLVIDLHARLGNRRTDNEIKNHWNTHIKKRLLKMGIDPITHQPLHNQTTDQNSQSPSPAPTHHFPDSEKTHHQINEPPEANNNNNIGTEENSCSPTDHHQNSSSSDESNFYENDPLISCLFRDDHLPDDQFPSPYVENFDSFCATSWDENCSWMLDCQDFGIHDFGFDCFNDSETNNALNELEMGINMYRK
ncbi:hypothetical protein DH2020_027611 [Rehmannia glutinosa]|uniref:R2R3-MYB protein n=1 Tax=Rehmannia glutinosa TaxID=99300 RepID=A0ABR0VVJ0_REHGL